MTVLSLTSPLTRGQPVVNAQRLLNVNRWGDFLEGDPDGIFGEDTAQACRRAKYRLGYPLSACTETFGEKLEAFLEEKVPLPATYKARRTARAKADQATPIGTKALAKAKTHLGVKESPPGSNQVVFSKRYGMIGPWCLMFVSCCYVDAGSVAFKLGRFWAYCPYLLADARQARNGVTITRSPRPGDPVLYDFNKDGVPTHVALFEAWVDDAHTRFTAIEGNTGSSSDADGGEVQRRTRDEDDVIAFVRVHK